MNEQARKAASRRSFDRQADCYDSAGFGQHARKLYPVLLAQLAQIPLCSVLDLGCGTGELLHKIAARWPETACAGVDLSPNMVTVAREKLGPRAEIALGDAEALPFPDGRFQTVVCCDSFHHYPRPGAVLEEVRRVLQPGGVFLLGDCTAPAVLRSGMNLLLPFNKDGDVRLYAPKELTALLGAVFTGAECRRVDATSLLAWGVKSSRTHP